MQEKFPAADHVSGGSYSLGRPGRPNFAGNRPPDAADLPPARWALFLDLDGTLIDFADRPEDVRAHPQLPGMLVALDRMFSGAVAIITGRSVGFVDQLLPDIGLTIVGLHGVQFRAGRNAPGLGLDPVVLPIGAAAAFGRALGFVRHEAAGFEHVLFEDKGAAFALHYRRAPEYEAAVQALMAQALQIAGEGFALRPGKAVIELCPSGRDKGEALAALMQLPPFAGRHPLAAGDDLTDEAMFAAVARIGGLSIGVGPRPSSAETVLASPAAMRGWLKGFQG
jgi:trehalose 6-phosphate phosphatase